MITKQMLEDFRKDFAEAMKDLETKYGVVIELGRISYSATSFDARLEVKEGESKEAVNEDEFKMYCSMYGLSKDDYDRRFTYQGNDYIIVGIRPSKRKYPIACQQVQDGKTYGFPPDLVKRLLK